MDTVFRTHVKNEARFDLLNRSIESAYRENLQEMGELYLVNDCSPIEWEDRLQQLAHDKNLTYFRVPKEKGDTKQGLGYSFHASKGFEVPTLYCTDDVVFGEGAKDEFVKIEKEYIKALEDKNIKWGMIGSFACYGRDQSFNEIPLWSYPLPHFYAMVCHVVNPDLALLYWRELFNWSEGNACLVDMKCCDDIFIKQLCIKKGYSVFNTLKDYAQHTGMNCRTFGELDAGSSNYYSNSFIGERSV